MKIYFGIIIILSMLIVGCTSNAITPTDPVGEALVEPFKLENVTHYKVTPKSIHGYMDSLDMEDGKKFLEAMNQSLNIMEVDRGPDIVVYMENNKNVEVRFGFYIKFIDGDHSGNYYLIEPSEELVYAFTKMIEEAESTMYP